MKFSKILSFLLKRVKCLGTRLIYSVLLMIYAYKSENTPTWARRIIQGSMAYLLSPLDSVPDLTPVFGFTDDLGVISFGLVAIACYIDDTIREQARQKFYTLFKNVDVDELDAVDSKL